MNKETFAEQIDRLELMADGDPQWDLSDNDRDAIRALLENYCQCIGESIRRSTGNNRLHPKRAAMKSQSG